MAALEPLRLRLPSIAKQALPALVQLLRRRLPLGTRSWVSVVLLVVLAFLADR